MPTLAARSADEIVQLANAPGQLGSVLVIVVAALLLVLLVRDIVAVAGGSDAAPAPAPAVRLNRRLQARRSSARRRAWALDPHGRRPMRYTVTQWVGAGYRSPTIFRWHARRAATRRQRRDWAVVRYPR